jgi:phage tail-like protein
MKLRDVAAKASPAGNQVELSWATPPAGFRVRVVRRETAYPEAPEAGVALDAAAGAGSLVDTGLRGETVYYYRLFPFEQTVGGSRTYSLEPPNLVSAMATSPAGLADEMYGLLPAIFRRYDESGLLRRYLELPGSQLDQLYSEATSLLGLLDVERVDGALLGLLDEWIGWRTDHSLDLVSRRQELRNAPALYHAVGLVAAIGATVQRVGRTPCRVKEFVHNVALTNHPARLTLWQLTRTDQTWASRPEPVSIDAAFGGRPAVAVEPDGGVLAVYEHAADGRFALRTKELGDGWGESARFRNAMPSHGSLAVDYRDPSLAVRGATLDLYATAYFPRMDHFAIARWRRTAEGWSGMTVLELPGVDPNFDCRRPVTVADGDGYLLFWLEDDDRDGRWILKLNRHDRNDFVLPRSPVVPMPAGRVEDVFAVVHPTDTQRRLWLFWATPVPVDPAKPLETRWRVSYRTKASTDPAASDWGEVKTLPAAADGDHDREPCAIVRADGDVELFWSSHRGGRWSIWRTVVKRTTGVAGSPERLPALDGAMRGPLAFARGPRRTVLLFRSDEPLPYPSRTFSAAETVDQRYAGTSTYHTREPALRQRRGTFEDAGSYVYDTGRTDSARYARDTVGVFVPAEADAARRTRAERFVRDFMPATDRAVFLTEG